MYTGDIYISGGGIASRNPIPDMRQWEGFLLEGWHVPDSGRGAEVALKLPECLLATGLLVLGSPGSGKTNVINRLTSQILHQLGQNDFAVILDAKGDYIETFYNDGDWIMEATNSRFRWNLFDELLYCRADRNRFEMKIHEMCEYLYEGRQSSNQPYFVNAARQITACMIKYLIYDAEERSDNTYLNNSSLARLLFGELRPDGCVDAYESYRTILESYEEFSGALIHIPPADQRNQSGDGVISEVVSMANDIFSGAFGAAEGGEYISGVRLLRERGKRVLFLRYNPALSRSTAYVFRLVLDWLLAGSADPTMGFGNAYFILDEMAVLPNLNYLDRTLNLARSQNVAVIGALQNVAQMYAVYPRDVADNILDAFQSLIVLRSQARSIQYVQKRFGSALVQRYSDAPDGGMRLGEKQVVPAVEDSEISRLECGTAFVMLADHDPFRYHFKRYARV